MKNLSHVEHARLVSIGDQKMGELRQTLRKFRSHPLMVGDLDEMSRGRMIFTIFQIYLRDAVENPEIRILTVEEKAELLALCDLKLKLLQDYAYDYLPDTAEKIRKNWSRGQLIALLFDLYLEGRRRSRAGTYHDPSTHPLV